MKKVLIPLLMVLGLTCAALAAPQTDHAADGHQTLSEVVGAHADDAHAADAHGAGGHGEGEGPLLLTVDLGMAVWSIVLFVVLLGVLGKFVWPPILKGLQEREDRIRNDLEQAKGAAAEATQTLEQYKAQLADARKEAQRIIDESRSEAEKVAAKLKDQAQADLTQMRQRAQGEIRAAKEQALSEIYSQAATLATQVAGRILQREITPDDQRTLVEASLAELGQAQKN